MTTSGFSPVYANLHNVPGAGNDYLQPCDEMFEYLLWTLDIEHRGWGNKGILC